MLGQESATAGSRSSGRQPLLDAVTMLVMAHTPEGFMTGTRSRVDERYLMHLARQAADVAHSPSRAAQEPEDAIAELHFQAERSVQLADRALGKEAERVGDEASVSAALSNLQEAHELIASHLELALLSESRRQNSDWSTVLTLSRADACSILRRMGLQVPNPAGNSGQQESSSRAGTFSLAYESQDGVISGSKAFVDLRYVKHDTGSSFPRPLPDPESASADDYQAYARETAEMHLHDAGVLLSGTQIHAALDRAAEMAQKRVELMPSNAGRSDLERPTPLVVARRTCPRSPWFGRRPLAPGWAETRGRHWPTLRRPGGL